MGDPLALGPPPEPKPSPAEGRWGEREPTAQVGRGARARPWRAGRAGAGRAPCAG